MCGFESLPTLPDIKPRIATEIKNVEEIKEATNKMSLDGIEELDNIQQVDKDVMKTAILLSITHLSKRIRELRELVVKKKIALRNILKQVERDWKTSKAAPAISFYKTKIVNSQSNNQRPSWLGRQTRLYCSMHKWHRTKLCNWK